MDAIYNKDPPRLAVRELGVSGAIDDVLSRALAKEPKDRFETADAMAHALEDALPPASDREIAEWVEHVAGDALAARVERVAAFEGDDTGGSKARLFAAKTSETATLRRDALVPPPLESVTNEHTTMRGPIGSSPTVQIEVAAALAATDLPGALPLEGVSEQRSLHTPLVMMAPADVGSDTPEWGATRIEPVERRPRPRTPIPIPMPPPNPAKRRARSMLQLVALVMLPPLVVAAALAGERASSRAAASVGGRGGAAAVLPTPAVAEPMPPATISAPAAAAEVKSDASTAPKPETSTKAKSDADAGAAPPMTSKPGRKVVRPPAHRVPRGARPVPAPVNR
jgi:serine/threonine-protein kinase